MNIKQMLLIATTLMVSSVFANDEPTPVPFVCDGEAYTVRDTPGELYRIDQSVSPFAYMQIGGTLQGPFGPAGSLVDIQVNNIGYRVVNNLLYGVALKAPYTPNFNHGLVKIDSLGTVFSVNTTPEIRNLNKRFLAGDIDPNTDKMFLNTYPPTSPMYVVDLSTLTVTEKPLVNTNNVFVADWAVNPLDGMLYGADGRCNPNAQIYQLDPNTGVITSIGSPAALPCSNSGDAQYYGGAWFNAVGKLFVYRNNDVIYEINLGPSPPVVDSVQDGADESSQFNDSTACAAGVPIVDKFYTYTNNNWEPRCVDEECTDTRLPNINLDDDIFADNLPQNDDDAFVLLGKQNGNKTVINPGQYIAVSNIQIPIEQDVWVLEDFSDCLDIGTVNPSSVPGGVQVVLVHANGDVEAIGGNLANGIGGSIELNSGAGYALVHVENAPTDSVLRVMVKFKPLDTASIGDSCVNHEIAMDESMDPIAQDSETLLIEPK